MNKAFFTKLAAVMATTACMVPAYAIDGEMGCGSGDTAITVTLQPNTPQPDDVAPLQVAGLVLSEDDFGGDDDIDDLWC